MVGQCVEHLVVVVYSADKRSESYVQNWNSLLLPTLRAGPYVCSSTLTDFSLGRKMNFSGRLMSPPRHSSFLFNEVGYITTLA